LKPGEGAMVGEWKRVANRRRIDMNAHACVRDCNEPRRIIYGLPSTTGARAMEAEQLNQIANALAGLRERESQLRRYL
jgi:hypothetical protein